MICIAGNLPVLQVGRYQVTGYSTRWIREAIELAAAHTQHETFAFTEDVYEGVIYYLEHKCSLRLLKLEDLYKRIAYMLSKIGYASIANALVPIAPPITISLERAAQDAGDGYELAFYKELQDELHTLKSMGAREIYFSHIEECIHTLKQTKTWNNACQELEADIMYWLTQVGARPHRQGYRIRVNLKQLNLLE